MTIALTLFGAPTVTLGGKSTALEFERRAQLVAYLALKRAWVSRSELAALLWPDQQPKLAHTNLRKAVFRLQSFPWADRIEVQAGALRFEAATDVAAFEAAIGAGRVAEALALRRGDLLTGFDDPGNDNWTNWLGFERDRLRAAWRSAAQKHLEDDLDPASGVEFAARLLEDDPLDDAALRALMTWLVRAGQGARARQAYRAFAERLQQELGLAPSSELKALHDTLAQAAATPGAAASSTPPARDDGFIGRTVEMRRIAALLAQPDCRLLCLSGPGGVGKTRLAQRATRELASEFPDGATFIPLDDLTSTGQLGGRLARELGVTLSGRTDALDQVIDALRGSHALLVLDNFEQLAAEASVLDRLLAACPGAKLIVTSRVRLSLAGEWLLPLEGLAVPDPEDEDRAEAFDAVRLFIRAARRVNPTLATASEAPGIVDICRQVEGLPLALELAASWTRVLSCQEIAAELRHGTELLHATDASQPARHASIDVVFQQSWQLLSDVERGALARLSVFHGSFASEAARAIAGAALPVLGALTDKSLLSKAAARLHLHPLVQQLAAARLGDGEGATNTRAAHAAYFHRLLLRIKPEVASGERRALQALDEEFENCRRAWSWSIEHGEADALARSVVILLDYVDYRGRFAECLSLVREAIESPIGQSDTRLQALLLSKAAHLMYRLDRYPEAEAEATRALAATRGTRDIPTKLQALNVLATCALRLGRLDDARRYFQQALESTSPEHHAHRMAITLDHLALIEKAQGRYDEALRLSMQSLVQHRALGDSAGEALCLNNLASLCLARREYEAAGNHLREGLAICDRDGIASTRAFVLSNLTEVSLRTGDLAAAEKHAGRGLEAAVATGNRAVEAWLKIKIARLAVRRGHLEPARTTLADGLGVALAIGVSSLKVDAVECFGELLIAQGESSCAQRVLAYAANHPAASAPDRDALREQLAAISAGPLELPAWPGLELDDLAHRIVVEADVAHAPLIAMLRVTPQTAASAAA